MRKLLNPILAASPHLEIDYPPLRERCCAMGVEGPAVRRVLATDRRDQLDHFLSVLLGHGNPQRMGLNGTPVHIP